MRCQEWYDAGNPSYEQQREHERKLLNAPLSAFKVVAGPPDLKVGSGCGLQVYSDAPWI